MDDIILAICGQEFYASKTNLSEYSDYFRAMFSGNYVENKQKRIIIDVIEPNIINIILQYMRIGLIDLSDHSLTTIGELAVAANFLQVTELIKQIQYYLDTHLSVYNWAQIMQIAESASFMHLQQLAAVEGLLSFKRMKPEYIPTIHRLFWCLSHSHLDAETEFDVFKFGYEWITNHECGSDALLVILCCLDYKKLTIYDLQNMLVLLGDNHENSLAVKVIECLKEHANEEREFYMSYFTKHKSTIIEKYTESVYKRVLNFIKSTITRKLVYTPAVPLWIMKDSKPESVPHCLYTFKKKAGFEKWLEVADKSLWGWGVVSWGLTKVVVVGGEHGRGTGLFMKDIRVYDVLRKEWTQHGVTLPSRRHAGLGIIEDSLYILGGVGGYRVVLDSAIVYDLHRRSYRKIASLPDAIQNPAVCIHNGMVYTTGHKNIYRYESDRDCWSIVISTDIHASGIVSYKGFLYCTQNYFTSFYRFKPGLNDTLEKVTKFLSCPPAQLCHLGDRLIVFTRSLCGHADNMVVEEYDDDYLEDRPIILWAHTCSDSKLKLNDVAGSVVLVMTMPPVDVGIAVCHKRYLDRFPEE